MTVSQTQLFRYHGLSMWPCFQEGDLLEVVATTPDRLRAGDCVVLERGDGTRIAHRVVGLHHGLRTRGDAVARDDDQAAQQLLGRIVACYRTGRRSSVAGGWKGLLAGKFYFYAGRIDPQRTGRGGRLGRMVRCVCAPLAGRLIRCHLPAQAQDKALVWKFGGYVVAQRQGSGEAWQVFWPWRLLISGAEGIRRGRCRR